MKEPLRPSDEELAAMGADDLKFYIGALEQYIDWLYDELMRERER